MRQPKNGSILLLKQLGANVIRVYAVDPNINHDDCMNQLSAAGIYVISGLEAPDASFIRNDPFWNSSLYTRYIAVIDNLARYNNLLGFFAANTVSNSPQNSGASAYVKAAVRDTKGYIKGHGYRSIGIGYATDDNASIQTDLTSYFNCGNSSEAIDFLGPNVFSWCDGDTFASSDYQDLTRIYSSYSVPVFLSEYGCGTARPPRRFTEVPTIYGDQMKNVWSGGIVYQYFEDGNNFGLVNIDGANVVKKPEFNAFASQIANVKVTGVNANSYRPTNSARACPAVSDSWRASNNLPPTPNRPCNVGGTFGSPLGCTR